MLIKLERHSISIPGVYGKWWRHVGRNRECRFTWTRTHVDPPLHCLKIHTFLDIKYLHSCRVLLPPASLAVG